MPAGHLLQLLLAVMARLLRQPLLHQHQLLLVQLHLHQHQPLQQLKDPQLLR